MVGTLFTILADDLKKFSKLGISAFLYPLIIRLESLGILEKQINQSLLTFFDLIEIADLRVYKVRGTDPARDISYLARDSKKISEIVYFLFNKC